MNGIKGILFDFGGTLDTNGTHWGIMLQEAYREAGFSLEDKIFREIYVQGERQLTAQPVIATNDTFREVLQKKLAIELDYGVTHGFLSDNSDTRNRIALIAEKCYATARDHIDGIRPLLKKLHNDYRLALVSNFYGNLSAVLDDFDLKNCFDTVIESARVGVRKPSPAIFSLALDTLQLSPAEAIVVGDSYKNDIAPALSLGIIPVWLKGRGWNDKDDRNSAPYIISDLHDLTTLLYHRT
ncbi:MAG TPA: HAD family hydrolase [Candidatus Caccoplasma intestinavium]|uniref:HAD family hydrolase n=1 Tax=Candidatus Caccoplasma intestinavium TaxID=2840716 RepID=A0A9D1GD54_9BACT|nr:HAD family hydrolase [Candidatus Caccoplasma intestinavium]